MKKAFHTVLRAADPSFSPTHTPHTHMHKHTETSLKVTLSQIRAVAEICIWMPTFVGKFKGPWGFCKFCSEPGGPMGTKSHISKALPASIMAQRIGLIVLQQATFRAGCVYLSLSGYFLYLIPALKYSVDAFLHHEWRRGDLESLCCFFLFYSHTEAPVQKSSFHVWD